MNGPDTIRYLKTFNLYIPATFEGVPVKVASVLRPLFFSDIGTSSNQWDKNLTGEPDICRWNRVYENYINTHVRI